MTRGKAHVRNSAWEDAIADELVTFGRQGHLILTVHGRAKLEHSN